MFDSLTAMDGPERQELLVLLDASYHPTDAGSGAALAVGGTALLDEGSLVELEVWRDLTPADLALLDRCGLWPVGGRSGPETVVAEVTGQVDAAALAGSGFLRRASPFAPAGPAEAAPPADWSGHFLVRTVGDPPVGGSWIADGWARVPGAPGDLPAILAAPGVLSVEWEPRAFPRSAADFRPDDSRRLAGFPGVWDYYQGGGVLTGVIDTGVWSGHEDLSPAVVQGPPDTDGHGTAVCGVIASRGTVPVGGEYDGRGAAFMGDLYVLERPEEMTPGQLAGLFSELSGAGCRLVNNSWGFEAEGYDEFCEVVDEWADTRDMVMVFSAGNLGEPEGITSPGMARNCITAGAVTYVPDSLGNCYLAPYSSMGPTPGDGRLKPDILAPGGAFTGGTMQEGVVTTNAMYGGDWLDDPDDRWPGEPSYTRYAGTSMAAAFVSGAVALCLDKYGPLIHPEDVAALMMSSAIPLAGNTGPPESGYATTGYGYGLLDAFHMQGVYFSEEVDRPLWVFDTYQEGTAEREWTFYIPSSVLRFSAAMAYCDVAGEGLGNDLDLTLVSPDDVEYEYSLPEGVTSESPVERIGIESPVPGAWTARISAESWSSPGNPFEEEQYSLAVYSYSRSPSLRVFSPADTTMFASPGDSLDIPLVVVNNGGYIVVGTWGSISAPSGFSGEVDVPGYLGNLVYRDAASADTFTVRVPTQPGTYQLTARAEGANLGLLPDSSVFEVLIAYPDLTVSVPSPDVPPPFQVGQSVRFTTVVTNEGEGPSDGCLMDLYLETHPDSSTNRVGSVFVEPLQGGESIPFTVDVDFTYFDLGTRYLAAEVDVDGQVTEADEGNNRSAFGPFEVEGILAPPSSLTAGSGFDGYVPLEWSPPAPESAGVDSKGLVGYRLYRGQSPLGPDPEPIADLPSSDTTYTDSLVSNGITYYYWATSVYQDPTGESGYSNMASATPQGPSGAMEGTVTDSLTGQRLRDVAVEIEHLGLQAVTDEEGDYTFGSVPVGPIPVRVDHEGYLPASDTVTILEGETARLDFALRRDLGEAMSVIPNPFTPNGDGINDVAGFIWPAAEGVPLTVTIYDMTGVPVRTIAGTEPRWDGLDDAGAAVSGGVYAYIAWAGDTRTTGVVCLAR